MVKWKIVEETLRAEGLKFGFSQMMGAVTNGEVTCEKSEEGLLLDLRQAREWAMRHKAAKEAKRKDKAAAKQETLFDSTAELRRIADLLERIARVLKA
jgi:hypothetical protein